MLAMCCKFGRLPASKRGEPQAPGRGASARKPGSLQVLGAAAKLHSYASRGLLSRGREEMLLAKVPLLLMASE